MADTDDAVVKWAKIIQKAKAGDTAAQNLLKQQAQVGAAQAAPQSGSIFMYFVYGIVAFVSPWLWILALIGWPIVAYLLPRSTDEEGKEHWRWRPAWWIAFFVSYFFAYMMVAAGFAMLPTVLKLAVL